MLQNAPGQLPVIVVDEVGKMELFSKTFEQVVRNLMSCSNVTLLVTIPEKRRIPVEFADEIRRSPTVHLFEVRMRAVALFLAFNFFCLCHVNIAVNVQISQLWRQLLEQSSAARDLCKFREHVEIFLFHISYLYLVI